MAIPPVRPGWWLISASGIIFIACLVLAAWLGREGHNSFGDNAAHDAVQALGAVALATGGVGAVIERRAARRWERALQVVAVDLLEETIRQTGAITSAAAFILLGDDESAREIADAFKLPWTEARDDRLNAASECLDDIVGSLTLTQETASITSRVGAIAADLAARADALRAAAIELEGYVTADHAIALVRDVAYLHRRVRTLIDESAHPRAALNARAVLDSGIDVALRIREPFEHIRRRLKDHDLRKELTDREEELIMSDAFARWKQSVDAVAVSTEQVEEQLAKLRARSTELKQRYSGPDAESLP